MKNRIFKIIHFCIFILLFINTLPSHALCKRARVGVLFENPPFSFIASAFMQPSGTLPRGLNVDIANAIFEEMDLPVPELYPMDNLGLIESLNKGHIDMIVGIYDNLYSMPDIRLVDTGLSVNKTCFVNIKYQSKFSYNDIENYSIAIEKSRDLTWLSSLNKNFNLIKTDSVKEAIELVDSGIAQVYVSDNNISTKYIINSSGYLNLKEIDVPIAKVPIVIALKSDNKELIAPLEKAYDKVKEKELYELVDKWIGSDYGYKEIRKRGIDYLIGGQHSKNILAILSVSLVVFFAIVLWNYMLKSKVLLATKNMQYSEQKYRDLIESSPDMIHIISDIGEIRLANKIAIQNLGFSNNKIISLTLNDIVLEEQKEDMKSFINKVFVEKYSNKEFILIDKSGKKINVEMVAATIKEKDGSENLACCFSRDLTERKRLEEKLIHSDRLALMGRMAAGIAHEINNPLWIILSNTEDMISHNLSRDELNECLKSIERNGLRAAKTIEDLLTFARPAPIKLVDLDLKQLVEESLIFLKQKLKKKKIQVEKRYITDNTTLRGDENTIQQLLINIILNAIQAISENGKIVIKISSLKKNNENKIILEVIDNGKGISDDKLECIFSPFYTSGKTNGFGLGLFMSKIIVEKHNGELEIKSEKGNGTVVTIFFSQKDEMKKSQKIFIGINE